MLFNTSVNWTGPSSVTFGQGKKSFLLLKNITRMHIHLDSLGSCQSQKGDKFKRLKFKIKQNF